MRMMKEVQLGLGGELDVIEEVKSILITSQ
jgi:hypothetical protein